MSFFDLSGAGLAVAQSGFDQEELVNTMIGHVRDPDPVVSQKGISQFFSYLKQLATLNGRIATGRTERTTRDSDGTASRSVVSGSQVISPSIPRPKPPTLAAREYLPPASADPGGNLPEGG